MPSKRTPALYFDEILRAIERIDRYVAGTSFSGFEQDLGKQDSVYYRLLVLTEAARRLSPEELALCPGPDWRSIRDLGNVLRHAYDSLDPRTIWNVIQNDLPPLKQEMVLTLREHFPEALNG